MKSKQGVCALCRKNCDLTFEHIPPKAAFNATPSRPVTGDILINDNERMPWDLTGLPYENQQSGMGRFSLCRECNNNTGTWYGNDYVKFTHIVHAFLADNNSYLAQGVCVKQIYPLRIIKQVLSMLCSINNCDDQRLTPLRSFVLNKEETGIDRRKYRICIYFTRSNLIKYAPISVCIHQTESGFKSIIVSEITAYPVGVILYLNPTDNEDFEGIDITSFSQYKYNDECTVEFPVCVKEVNNIFPIDFRSKKQIISCIEENRNYLKTNATSEVSLNTEGGSTRSHHD